MPSPFPGMDPDLEHPRSWPNFHHRLITAIAIYLGPQLRPKYRVVVEEAMYQANSLFSVSIATKCVDTAVRIAQNERRMKDANEKKESVV